MLKEKKQLPFVNGQCYFWKNAFLGPLFGEERRNKDLPDFSKCQRLKIFEIFVILEQQKTLSLYELYEIKILRTSNGKIGWILANVNDFKNFEEFK